LHLAAKQSPWGISCDIFCESEYAGIDMRECPSPLPCPKTGIPVVKLEIILETSSRDFSWPHYNDFMTFPTKQYLHSGCWMHLVGIPLTESTFHADFMVMYTISWALQNVSVQQCSPASCTRQKFCNGIS
jgi:hypothetical protein